VIASERGFWRLAMTADAEVTQVAWRVPEWARATGVGRSKVYQLLAAGTISSACIGRRRVIVTPPADFIKTLPAAPGMRWATRPSA
jgi:hypothetical protein